MNKNDPKSWEQAIRNTLKDAEIPASDTLWNRIASANQQTILKRNKRNRWIWGMSIAAILTFAMISYFLFEGQLVDQDQTLTSFVPNDSFMVDSQTSDQDEFQRDPVDPQTLPISVKNIDKPESNGNNPVKELILNREKDCSSEKVDSIKIRPSKKNQLEEIDANGHTPSNKPYDQQLKDRRKPKKNNRRRFESLIAMNLGGNAAQSNNLSQGVARQSSFANRLLESNGYMNIKFEEEYQASSIKHHLPIGLSLGISNALSRRFAFVYGLNYTLLKSDVSFENRDRKMVQKIQFVGVPIRCDYKIFDNSRFSIYAGVGATLEYCISAKVGDRTMDEKNFHYSANATVGTIYYLNRWLGFYLEPDLSRNFTTTRLRSIRNESPTTFSMRMGFRLNFRN